MKENEKTKKLEEYTLYSEGKVTLSNTGVPVNDEHHTLKAGKRGPSLLEDFLMKEKMAHFDRERIPERVVHARGTAVHGVFKLSKDMSQYTRAKVLTQVGAETPVFVRFSTVAGFRGSADLARDVRGFSVKFYTEEGNWDLVGNNIPVFFVQDANKFPDLVHAVKPEQDNEMPQAASAHDTFWDFISLMPEASHMIMWTMSDRAIPRSYRMMEGFGVHTFKLVNEEGKVTFVKFHWKPKLGVHSVAWDEATKVNGKDSDFHRRDLLNSILEGNYPEWDLGVQLVPQEDEHKFDFDLLDPTKLIPEELIPVEIIGTMTLNRVPNNFFAEVEQVAYCPSNIVPGIDFSNDPLLQGRILSYTDTQVHRLGTANFNNLPINQPLHTVHNNRRDGFFQTQIPTGKANYSPNTLGDGCPYLAKLSEGGFVTAPESIDQAVKVRGKSEKFFDFFSQAILFYNSQSEYEQQHIKDALSFELSKVNTTSIKERMVKNLTNIDMDLAQYVAEKIGVDKPTEIYTFENKAVPAGADPADFQAKPVKMSLTKSKALSMANQPKKGIKTREIGVFIADGVDDASLENLVSKIKSEGGKAILVAPKLSDVKTKGGKMVTPDKTVFNHSSVLLDAVAIVKGDESVKTLANTPEAIHFFDEAYTHCKAVGFDLGTEAFFEETHLSKKIKSFIDEGVVLDGDADKFISAVAGHRVWDREQARKVPS